MKDCLTQNQSLRLLSFDPDRVSDLFVQTALQVLYETEFINGNGVGKEYFENGQIHYEYHFKDGKLISRFKGVDFPGTGFSIGVDRLVFVMNHLPNHHE